MNLITIKLTEAELRAADIAVSNYTRKPAHRPRDNAQARAAQKMHNALVAYNDAKPALPAPQTAVEIKAHLRKHWNNSWWGLMDCDRCSARRADYPCDNCGTWPDLIDGYRRRHKTKENQK